MMTAMNNFQECQQDQEDVEKAELIKGNNKKSLWQNKTKIHCGIKNEMEQGRQIFLTEAVKMLMIMNLGLKNPI